MTRSAINDTEQLSDKVQAKLRKLQALAERGEGGEKANAQRMLEKLLTRHGLSLNDLSDEQRKLRWFPAPTKWDIRLAAQIMAKVCNTDDPAVYGNKSRPKQLGVEVSPAEAIEFEIHYDTLRKALKEHFRDAFSAFVQAHRLFSALPNEETQPSISERDLRVMTMASAIETVEIHPRLEHSREAP